MRAISVRKITQAESTNDLSKHRIYAESMTSHTNNRVGELYDYSLSSRVCIVEIIYVDSTQILRLAT